MSRPSHYLLLSFAVFGAFLWWTGKLEIGAASGKRTPVVVQPPAPSRLPRPFEAVLRGCVLDPQGWPVADAIIRRLGVGETAVQSDTEGRFRLDLRGIDPVDLVVEAPSFRSLCHRVFPAVGDPVTLALEPLAPWDAPVATPELPRSGSLAGEGFVKDAAGRPVAGALVTVAETGFSVRTSEIGQYTVALPDGPATLVVHAPDGGADGMGWAAVSDPLRLSRREGLAPLPELVVKRGTAVRGMVRDPAGNPMAGAPVMLRGRGLMRQLETDPNGAFAIAGLLTGSYELVAMACRGSLGLERSIELGPNGVDEDFLLIADPARRLQIVDGQNRAVGGAHVAVARSGRRQIVAQADAEGWVDLRGLGGEDVDIEVRPEDAAREMSVVRCDPEAGLLVVDAP